MRLLDEIKNDEGFEGMPYKDSLGIDTIGIGTKLPISEDEAELLAKVRLQKKIDHLLSEKPIVLTLTQSRQEVLFNMAYQLGVNGLLKFKNMWSAIEARDYNKAADEMLDSRWYTQTPNRAKKLSDIMRG